MKNVRIKKIALHYFKGTQSREVEFSDSETIITAPNGAGKSTIVDAFFWCLWGKNAAGQSDQKFNVKTLDRNGVEIPHVNHEVELTLSVDGDLQTFKRVLVPEYDKDDALKGNHTDYFWNDVPMRKSEYDKKVGEVVSENVFKLITSPYAFLSLDWQKQRETLMRLAGDVKDEEVGEDGEFEVLAIIFKTKTLEQYRAEIIAKLKKTNEAMASIPARIDEVRRNLPEAPDMEAIAKQKSELEALLKALDNEENAMAEAYKIKYRERIALSAAIVTKQEEQQNILQEAQAEERREIAKHNIKYDDCVKQLKLIDEQAKNDQKTYEETRAAIVWRINQSKYLKDKFEKKLEGLREAFKTTRAKEFDTDEYLKCPLYGHICQDGEACSKYDQNQGAAFETFIKDKKETLESINEEGKDIKNQVEMFNAEINEDEKNLATLDEDAAIREKQREAERIKYLTYMDENPRMPLTATIKGEEIPRWVVLRNEIIKLKEQLDKTEAPEETGSTGVNDRRNAIIERLTALKAKETIMTRRKEQEARVSELESNLQKLAREKTILEQEKQNILDFEIAKIAKITDKVNEFFKLVKWRMFQKQVNGEEVPACICLCGGVPYNDANSATRLNAGIDVAYTLSQASNVSAPMFIDGAESSGHIYYPGGQRILLAFEKGSRELQVTTK